MMEDARYIPANNFFGYESDQLVLRSKEADSKMVSLDDNDIEGPPAHKRPRTSGAASANTTPGMSTALSLTGSNSSNTSSSSSSTLQLSGHKGSVTSLAYHGSGSLLASTSTDRTCLVWSVIPRHVSMTSNGSNYQDQDHHDNDDDDGMQSMNSPAYQEFLLQEYCAERSVAPTSLASCHDAVYLNTHAISNHKNAVLDCCWLNAGPSDASSSSLLATCGADKTIQLHDLYHGGKTVRTYKHDKIVNAISSTASQSNSNTCTSSSTTLLASASDDGTCRLWDARQKHAIASLSSPSTSSNSSDMTTTTIPLTAVALNDSHIYTGGLDNLVVCWDWHMLSNINSSKPLYALKAHTDTICCLAMHPDGTHLLSYGMDAQLCLWDIQPFVAATNRRLVHTYRNSKQSAEQRLLKCAWNSDGTLVSCGSADKLLHIYDTSMSIGNDDDYDKELYVLPGHKGCVNAVAFHPQRPNVVASGSADHHVLVGELS